MDPQTHSNSIMPTPQPTPHRHHGDDDDGPLGGGPGAGDPMVEDVDEENIGGRANGFGIDEHEFGFDEELNIGRIGENRAHLDDGFCIPEFDDLPDGGVGGRWTAVNPEIVELTVNGASGNNSNYYVTRNLNSEGAV